MTSAIAGTKGVGCGLIGSCQLSDSAACVMLQIKLSTKSFGRDAAEVASEAIANVSERLVDVDMSDVIAGRPEAEALEALRIISNALSRLQLRWRPAQLHSLLWGLHAPVAEHAWQLRLARLASTAKRPLNCVTACASVACCREAFMGLAESGRLPCQLLQAQANKLVHTTVVSYFWVWL